MKQVIFFGLAVCFSFMLFVVMHLLIKSDAKAYVAEPNTPIVIDTKLNESQPPKINRSLKRPELDEIKKPPTQPSTKTQEPVKEPMEVADAFGTTLGFSQKFNPNLSLTGFRGDQVLGGNDSGASPKVRIEPMYPQKAARDGKQGFVVLSFDISPQGEPTNIAVVDSDPRGYFEQSAKRALRKWQYSPKREEGIAVAVLNQSIKLEFKLEG